MPLTRAREHGVDTRIPGFGHHDQDGDRASTLTEWKHGTKPIDRLSQPRALAVNGFFLNTTAHPRLYRARLHPSRRQVLAATTFGTDANQRNFSDKRGFARPFAPSSPSRGTLLPAERIGGFVPPPQWGSRPSPAPVHFGRLPLSGEPDRLPPALLLANGRYVRAGNGQRTNAFFSESGQPHGFPCRFGTSFSHSTPRQRSPRMRQWASPWRSHPAEIRFALVGSRRTAYQGQTPILTLAFIVAEAFRHPAHPDLSDQARISDVIQDSDFRTEIASPKKRPVFPPSLCASVAPR
jgi:hypothetical protein